MEIPYFSERIVVCVCPTVPRLHPLDDLGRVSHDVQEMCSGRARVVLHEDLPAQLVVFRKQKLVWFPSRSEQRVDAVELVTVGFNVRPVDVVVGDLLPFPSELHPRKCQGSPERQHTVPPLLTPSWKWSSKGFSEISPSVFLMSASRNDQQTFSNT